MPCLRLDASYEDARQRHESAADPRPLPPDDERGHRALRERHATGSLYLRGLNA